MEPNPTIITFIACQETIFVLIEANDWTRAMGMLYDRISGENGSCSYNDADCNNLHYLQDVVNRELVTLRDMRNLVTSHYETLQWTNMFANYTLHCTLPGQTDLNLT